MAKKIYPGNYVNNLASYANPNTSGVPTGVVAMPGRIYYHVVGYGLIPFGSGNAVTSVGITIPSPDRRPDDKPRPDQTSLVIPTGAKVYHLGIRVPDLRKDRGIGTAFSGIVGTNTDRLKFADALANDDAMTTTTLSTPSASLPVASTTIAPGSAIKAAVTPVVLAGNETMSVFVTNSSGTSAGTALYSSVIGGTPIIVEVAYYLDDTEVPDLNDVQIPFVTETL
jgi:hypothetical protein